MVAAHVAISWRNRSATAQVVFEDLEVATGLAFEHAHAAQELYGLDPELSLHPVGIGLIEPDLTDQRATDHFDEKPRCGLDAGDSNADEVGARQPR